MIPDRNILEGIDALSALERFETVSQAAARLRLTQSAVSKRLQALQAVLGCSLVEPDGRRLRLTAHALRLLERARPLVAELRSLGTPSPVLAPPSFSLALSDSIAASWGPRVLARVRASLPGLNLQLHAHRTALLLENVRLGRYHLGLSTDVPSARDLIRTPVVEEPIVLVDAANGRVRRDEVPLITIEPSSATWSAIEPQLRQRRPELLKRRLVPVESFGAALQMARAGFGDALLPLGLAREMGLGRSDYRRLGGVSRSVSLFSRKTIYLLPRSGSLRDSLVAEAAGYFARA